jgi:hypothetical protein
MEMDMQSPAISSVNGHRAGSAFLRFLLKTGFVLFLTVDICAGFLYLLYSRSFRWVEVIPTALAVFSGLTAGILSRVFFRNLTGILRWFIACLVIAMTLALAGLVIQEWIHIDLTGIWFALVKPDFAALTGIGWITALPAIFAWPAKRNMVPANQVTPVANIAVPQFESNPVILPARRPLKTRKTASSRKRSFSIIPETVRKHYFRKNIWRRWIKKSKTNLSHSILFFERNVLKPIETFFKQIVEPKPVVTRSSFHRFAQTATSQTVSPVISPTPLPRKRLGRRMRGAIRLVGKEELRCPYCLQEVYRNDPRGVVICPICKSAHHKECWDITGSCQVPHNHAVL